MRIAMERKHLLHDNDQKISKNHDNQTMKGILEIIT